MKTMSKDRLMSQLASKTFDFLYNLSLIVFQSSAIKRLPLFHCVPIV